MSAVSLRSVKTESGYVNLSSVPVTHELTVLSHGFALMLQREWTDWREEDTIVPPEPPAGLGKITEQKGILGPGPAELRFAEAL